MIMKKIFLLLFVTSQLMSSNLDYKIVGSLGLGSVCLLAAGYFTYSAKEAGRKFDEDKEADIKKRKTYEEQISDIEANGGFANDGFDEFYNKVKEEGLIINNFNSEKYIENYKMLYNENKAFNLFKETVLSSSNEYKEENRPSLLTFKTITPGLFALAFFGFGGLKYRNATS